VNPQHSDVNPDDVNPEDLRQLELACRRAEADIQFIVEAVSANTRAHAAFLAEMKRLRAAVPE
jgi:hypothetical protein